MKVELSPAARRDRRKAEAWYRHESPAAAREFDRRLRDALRYISAYPEGAPIIAPGLRAKTLNRFPFAVVYEIQRHAILVFSIADERRDPLR